MSYEKEYMYIASIFWAQYRDRDWYRLHKAPMTGNEYKLFWALSCINDKRLYIGCGLQKAPMSTIEYAASYFEPFPGMGLVIDDKKLYVGWRFHKAPKSISECVASYFEPCPGMGLGKDDKKLYVGCGLHKANMSISECSANHFEPGQGCIKHQWAKSVSKHTLSPRVLARILKLSS